MRSFQKERKIPNFSKKFSEKIGTRLNWLSKINRRQSIASKIISSIALISILGSVMIGGVGIYNIANISGMSNTIYTENLAPLSPLNKIERDFLQIQIKASDIALYSSDYDRVNDDSSQISSMKEEIISELGKYSKNVSSAKERSKLGELSEDIGSYTTTVTDASNQLQFGSRESGLKAMDGDASKFADNFNKVVTQIYQLKIQQAQQRNQSNTRAYYIAVVIMAAIVLVVAVASFLCGRKVAKSIGKPIRKLVDLADSVSNGDLSHDVDIDSKDEVGTLAQSFKKIMESLHLLKQDVDMLVNGALDGKLSTRADVNRHKGAYREIIDGVNKSLDVITGPLSMASDCMDKISRGNIPDKIAGEYKGDFNMIKNSLNTCIDAVNRLITDANMLSQAAVEGRLSVRADATKHQGDFRKIIEGVDNTLDAMTGPMKEAAENIGRISRGDIPEKIAVEYKGDFNMIKNSLNTCIDAVNGLISDANMLSQAAVEGRLSIRADATKHQGDFRKIIEGVNDTLDAVTGPLGAAAACVDRISRGDIPEKFTEKYNGDFSVLINNLNTCIDAINGLTEDADMLSDAAVKGELSVRADAGRHQGGYRRIIEGVNHTLDAFIEPVKETADVLAKVAEGNLKVSVEGNFQGDLAKMKDALNETITAMSGYISEISQVLAQVSAGNFNINITSDYKGDFAQIKDSINNIILSFNKIISEILKASDQVATGSKQLSDGSANLSAGATEQADSIEKLTGSISQIAEKTRSNAEYASKANNISSEVQHDVEKGSLQMKDMLTSISDIKQSATDVSKINKVIDEIAFQTNILALNAAVEAARAGQYGKGFSVVAEEVRNLATRSSNAAKETENLIEKAVKNSLNGTQIANATAESFEKILGGVQHTAKLVGQINASSNEQAAGIGQINTGIAQVSQIVQTNSATAEESAAASEELSSQADRLREMVGNFKLSEDFTN